MRYVRIMARSRIERTPSAVFGRRVAEARLDRNWSQQELADKVGVNRTDVWKLENGERTRVAIDELLTYAAILGLPPIDLLVPLDDTQGIEIAGKVRSARAAREWIVGRGTLRGTERAPARYLFRQMPRARLRALVDVALEPPPEKRLAWALAGLGEKHDELVDKAVDLLRNLPIDEEEEGNG